MAKIRGHGEGTITQRADGRWEARMSLPNGQRKSFYGKTQREVQQKLKQAQRDFDSGLPVIGHAQTVAEYLESWLQTIKPQIRIGSWLNYRSYASNHIQPIIGRVKLTKLTPQQIQVMYSALLEKGLSPTTVHRVHEMFHKALKDAVELELLQRNVADIAKAPRIVHREMQTLSEIQARYFVDGVAEDRFGAMYLLAVTTGMRLGELLGLRWQDVNFEKREIVVRMSAHRVPGGLINAETKTQHSRRKIALSQRAVNALHEHKNKQHEERIARGSLWDTKSDLVFPNTVGRIQLSTDLVQGPFKKHLARLGLPNIRFHDLRHTAATILLARGVHIKVVSELLGHSDIAITLRVYGHVLPHMHGLAADVMDAVLAG